MSAPLLEVTSLTARYPVRGWLGTRGLRTAVDDVSFSVERQEVLGVVGASGAGKTSLARALLRLIPATGRVVFDGRNLLTMPKAELRAERRRIQPVFQDAAGALDPRMTAVELVEEGLAVHRLGGTSLQQRQSARAMLSHLGLSPPELDRHPHELSGGQRQRVGLARALVLRPELLIADEPLSALDVSVQAHILNSLAELRAELGLTVLFISHDLRAHAHFATRLAVMAAGRVVELAPVPRIFDSPLHPATQALLRASPGWRVGPEPAPGQTAGSSAAPSAAPGLATASVTEGCAFASACPRADARCGTERPALVTDPGGHQVACFHPGAPGGS